MMNSKLSTSELEFIISRVLSNANDTAKESESNKNDDYIQGKKMAYYEILDTIKNELEAREVDIKELGLDITLEKLL